MPLVWWLQILLCTVNFTSFVTTIITKSNQDNNNNSNSNSQLLHPPMKLTEDQRHFRAKDLKRLSTLSLRRDKNYLIHVPNTSIGQPVAKHETFHEQILHNSHRPHVDRPVHSSDAGPLSRRTCLYNKCSEGHVWITKSTIFANESKCSPRVELELQSVGQGHDGRPVFTIKGLAAKKFICFNKEGKIVTKSRGHDQLCRFQESINSLYTVYQSEVDHTWFLSFDRHGKRSSVPSQLQRKDPMKCRRFIPRPLEPGLSESSEDSGDVQSSSGFVSEMRKSDTADRSSRRHHRRNHPHNHRKRHNDVNNNNNNNNNNNYNNNNNNNPSSHYIQDVDETKI